MAEGKVIRADSPIFPFSNETERRMNIISLDVIVWKNGNPGKNSLVGNPGDVISGGLMMDSQTDEMMKVSYKPPVTRQQIEEGYQQFRLR